MATISEFERVLHGATCRVTRPRFTVSGDQSCSIDEAEVTHQGSCLECLAGPATS